MASLKLVVLAPALLGLAACNSVGPLPGTPEFLAARVSRAYDCGVRVDRNRVIARLDRSERPRFIAANAGFAVKSYKAPQSCGSLERASVAREVSALAKR